MHHSPFASTDNLITFPTGFLWGSATSSHQVEGQSFSNDWWEWEQEAGRIAGGGTSRRACEWWAGRAEEDLHRAAAMGHTAHRLSLEWGRLQPEPGRWDEVAFERYRAILRTIADLGMTALVTLNHFTLPLWVSQKAGWLNNEVPALFGQYVAETMRRLGEMATWWATLNEPMILAYLAYGGRRWSPGTNSLPAATQAAANMLRAHHAGYLLAKAMAPNAQVGLVLNMPTFDPARDDGRDRLVANIQDYAMNRSLLNALIKGRLELPLGVDKLAAGPAALDWVGVNYYGRMRIQFDAHLRSAGRLFGREVQRGVRHGENSWGEEYPAGLTRALRRLAVLGKPMVVTENGIFDATDTHRPSYMLRHIQATHDAIREGLDVRGYIFWSLIDNFEWAEGWQTPFGLIALDPDTQERTPRPSAALFEQVARANGIPRSLSAYLEG